MDNIYTFFRKGISLKGIQYNYIHFREVSNEIVIVFFFFFYIIKIEALYWQILIVTLLNLPVLIKTYAFS